MMTKHEAHKLMLTAMGAIITFFVAAAAIIGGVLFWATSADAANFSLGVEGPPSAAYVYDSHTSATWYPGYDGDPPRYGDPMSACRDLIRVKFYQGPLSRDPYTYGQAFCKLSDPGCADVTLAQHIESGLIWGGIQCWNLIETQDVYSWRYAGLVLVDPLPQDSECEQVPVGHSAVIIDQPTYKDAHAKPLYIALDIANIATRSPYDLDVALAVPDEHGLIYPDGQFDSLRAMTTTVTGGLTYGEVIYRSDIEAMYGNPEGWTGRLDYMVFEAYDQARSDNTLKTGCVVFE